MSDERYKLSAFTGKLVSIAEEGETKTGNTAGMVPQMVYGDNTMGPIKGSELGVTALRTDTPQTFEDTSFVSGDSPATLDCNAALSRNATEFSIQNDGSGDFTISISFDGVAFGDEKTVKNGEVYSIDNISVDSIRVTHVTDSAYRVTVL